MRRFEHEAARQDPSTGIVYMTEDNGDPADGFYRYVPNGKMNLSARGRQAAGAGHQGQAAARHVYGQTVGVEYDTAWVDVADPDPENAEDDAGAVYKQGLTLGAALIYGARGSRAAGRRRPFVASEAGDAEKGASAWSFTPNGDGGKLKLLYESADGSGLDQPGQHHAFSRPNRSRAHVRRRRRQKMSTAAQNWLRFLNQKGKIFDFSQNITKIDLYDLDDEEFPGGAG